MKTIFTIALTAVAVVLILRSALTLWRIVKVGEVTSRTSYSAPQLSRGQQPAADHSVDWMHDPNYRTALEKTTVVGHPEQAREREATPSPSP